MDDQIMVFSNDFRFRIQILIFTTVLNITKLQFQYFYDVILGLCVEKAQVLEISMNFFRGAQW